MMSKMFEDSAALVRSNTGKSGGKFMTQKFVSSTKIGPDGRPIKESYQSKAHGVYGGNAKPELVERKQMYQNSGTGYEKAAHERMYQGKGRKVVIENDRGSNRQNSYNYYKGLREEEAPDFDREWESAANRLGFNSKTKALEYGSGLKPAYQRSSTHSNYDYEADRMDDRRRGDYVPSYLKGPDMPVKSNQPSTHVERLMPADVGHRLDVPNNRAAVNRDQLALPSNDNRGVAPRQRQVNNRNQVNYRAPNGAKRARVG